MSRIRVGVAAAAALYVALGLASCAQAPGGVYFSDAQARASQVPGLIQATHEGVKHTQAYLLKHPHATEFTQTLDSDSYPVYYQDGYVMYADSHDSWDDWYIVANYGGGHTDGAYYYSSHTGQYYVCGSKSYLQQNWHVPKANRFTYCPAELADNVDSEVLVPR